MQSKSLHIGRVAVSVGVASILATGCASLGGPEYERPEAPQKADWTPPETVALSAGETINPEWWRQFGDPELDTLVQKAIAGNIDLKILVARTGVATAAIRQVKAASLPSLNAGLGANFSQSTGGSLQKSYNAATSLNWEVDIWGKVKKGVAAQTAEVRATQADWRAGYLSLVADVATAYFQILQLDEQAAQQTRTLGDAERTLGIFEDMHREGMIPRTQLLQQKAEINQLKKDLLELQRLRKITENGLATLLGIPAGDFHVPPGKLTQNIKLIDVPAGLPSDLLERRPDIVAAEYRVLQAHNLTSEARLARLPSFGLTGRLGTSSFALTDLLKSFTAGLLPTLNIPILDPSVNARLRVSEAQAEVAREEYKNVVIKAYEDVETSLVNLNSHKEQREELQSQLEKLRVVADSVRAQLREGMVSQLEVFESERTLLAAELALLENKQQILSDTVRLYKALGGGWDKDVVASGQ